MYNAMKEEFEEITILDKPAILTSVRIDRCTVPSGYHLYNIHRDDLAFGGAYNVARTVTESHWGSIITRDKIELPHTGQLKIEPEALQYDTGDCQSMMEFMEKFPSVEPIEKANNNTAYRLSFTQDNHLLFSSLHGELAERHGSIGYMRVNFGDGQEFKAVWHNNQPHLKTSTFKREFQKLINHLRDGGQEPPFASRSNLEAFCAAKPGKKLETRGNGYMIRAEDYSYYFHCLPLAGNYEIECFAYDNRWLLPELAGQHELPDVCYSTLPTTGELILIKSHEKGYYPSDKSSSDPAANRKVANTKNKSLSVTRAQEEACLAGSMFGWDTKAACPWKYEQDGTLRKPPKKTEPER